jgi:hypothetical protein
MKRIQSIQITRGVAASMVVVIPTAFFDGFSVFWFTLSAAIAPWYFVEHPSHLRTRMIKVRGGVRVWEQQ